MIRRPPRSTRTYTHFPYTTRFRSRFSAMTITNDDSLAKRRRRPRGAGATATGNALGGKNLFGSMLKIVNVSVRGAAMRSRFEADRRRSGRQIGRAHV